MRLCALSQRRRVCHSKFGNSFDYSLNTSHAERKSFMQFRKQLQNKNSCLMLQPSQNECKS